MANPFWTTRQYNCVLSEAERYFLILALKEYVSSHPDYMDMFEDDASVITTLISELEELSSDRR